MALRDYQQRAIDLLYAWMRYNAGNPCVVMPTGCHAKGQGILMADGHIKKVEEICVGDVVMGGDGTPRNVKALYHGESAMYKIIPIKGKSFIVNKEHILSLISTNEGKKWRYTTTGTEIANISVENYLQKSKNWKHLHKLYRGRVEHFAEESTVLPIPPYIVGILLGDGSLFNGASLTTPDPEIYEAWHEYLASIGCTVKIRPKRGTNCSVHQAVTPNLKIPGAHAARGMSKINRLLKEAGLWRMKSKDKSVPHQYKTSNTANRLELLAGLIDTDGYLGTNCYDWISKSEQLAKDVVFICNSVGLRAVYSSCIKTCTNTGKSDEYFRVSISGDCNMIPCRVKRKQASPRKQKKRVSVTGFSVEYVGWGEYYGFEVDGDHLYMLDDFTVTHNSGKSHVIAGLCRDILTRWPQSRILVLSHVKELLEQDAEKILLAWPEAPLGIYSAGIGSRDVGMPVTVAGIQSVRDKAEMLGYVDLVIVDEAHTINHKAEGGYRKLLDELKAVNPNMRIVGLTATPYRLGHGLISEHGAIFDGLVEPVSVAELIARGYLAPLRSKLTDAQLSVDGVGKRGGEYIEHELQQAVNNIDDNERIVDEVISRAGDRKAWLFFCAGVAHSMAIRDTLRARGVSTETVTGETPKAERERIIRDYKAGRITALTNANVLTTGFDYPDIDLIAMLRPTLSPGLYVQMAGRGMRLKSHTDHCLVLDFAGNVKRHGPITDVAPPKHKGTGTGDAPVKVCEQCAELVHTSIKVCPACGYEFPPVEKEPLTLHGEDIMGGPEEMRVREWLWYVKQSRAKQINMLCVDYYNAELTGDKVTEYITILHDGYARYKAEITLRDIIAGCGADISLANGINENYLEQLAEVLNDADAPETVTIKKDGRYYRVLARHWQTAAVGA